MKTMRILLTGLVLFLAGCLTSGTGEKKIDLHKVHLGLEAAENTLWRVALANEGVDYDLALELRKCSGVVRQLDEEVERALAAGHRVPNMDFVLHEIDTVVLLLLDYTDDDKEQQQVIRNWGVFLGGALDLVKIALEPQPPVPKP